MSNLQDEIELRGANLVKRLMRDLVVDCADITITLAKGGKEGDSIRLVKDMLNNTISFIRDLKLEDKSTNQSIETLVNYLKKVSFVGYKLNDNKEGQLILFNDLLDFGKTIGLGRYNKIKEITLGIDREVKPQTYDELVRKLNVVGLSLGDIRLINLENFGEIFEVLKVSNFDVLDETYRYIKFNINEGNFEIEEKNLDKLNKLRDSRMPY